MDKKTLVIETTTAGVDQSEQKLRKLGATAGKTEKATDRLGATAKKTGTSLVDKLQGGASKVADFFNGKGNSATSKFIGSLSGLMKTIGGVKAAMVVMIAVGVIAFLNNASKAAEQFNAQLANVATLIPGNTQRVQELGDGIQAMAIKVGSSMSDLTDATYQVISAFPELENNAQILDTLDISAKAAKAGVSSTADAINLLSAVSKGYGDTSRETLQTISDLAFVTVQLGQTTFPELSAAIGQAVPLANALGVSMEELFAAEATLTGVTGSASEVTTQLRSIFTSLVKPTEEMTALMKEFGASSGKEFIETAGGIGGVLQAVKTASEQSGTELAAYFGRVEAVTAALALSGAQAETFSQRLKDMEDAAGATAQAFQEISDGVDENGFAIQRAAIAWSVLKTNIGEMVLPFKALIADGLTPVFELFGNLFKMIGSAIQVNSRLIRSILAMTGTVLILKVAFALLNGVFAAVTNAFRWLDQYIKLIGAALQDVLAPTVRNLRIWFLDLIDPVIAFFNKVNDGIPRITALEAALWTVEGAMAALGTIFDLAKFAVKAQIDAFIDLWEAAKSLGPLLRNIFTGRWDRVGESARAVGEKFKQLGSGIRDNWDELMTSMGNRWFDMADRVEARAQTIKLAPSPLGDIPGLDSGGTGGAVSAGGGAWDYEDARAVDTFSQSYKDALKSIIEGEMAIDRNAIVMEQLGMEYDAAAEKASLYDSTLQTLFDSSDATGNEIQQFTEYFGDLNTSLEQTPSLLERIRDGFVNFFAETKKQAATLKQVFDDMAAGLGRIAKQQYLDFFTDIGGAMEDGVISGREWGNVIASIGMAILQQLPLLFMQAGLTLIAQGMWPLGLAFMAASAGAGIVSGYVEAKTSSNAKGNAFDGGAVTAFSKGSAFTNTIVTQPTLFAMANGSGLMGEAGPEAVMPLTRTPDGSLGVKAEGGAGAHVNVVIINNSGEDVETTESEGVDGSKQIEVFIGQAMKRHVGQGTLDPELSSRYGMKVQGY